MNLLLEIRQQMKRSKITTFGDRMKLVGLTILGLCVIVGGLALGFYAVTNLLAGAAIGGAILALTLVIMAWYGTAALLLRTLTGGERKEAARKG